MKEVNKSYRPVKEVSPIEIKDLIGFEDEFGNSYVGIMPDIELEPWFNGMIEEYSLNTLMQMYPYQDLMVDKETGLLIPVNQRCPYNAKLTNCFHVIYHMRLNRMKTNQQPNNQVQAENTENVQKPTYRDFVDDNSIGHKQTIVFNNLINEAVQKKAYGLNLEGAYHKEKEEIKYENINPTESLVQNKEDENSGYGFKNEGGVIDLPRGDNVTGWHPNKDKYGNYIDPNGIVVADPQFNPYAYNPQQQQNTSYIPQYRRSL